MNSKLPQLAQGIGVMSGTSLDGLDLTYCRFCENPNESLKWEVVQAETVAFPAEWRERLSRLTESSAAGFARTDVALGRFIGERVARFIKQQQLPLNLWPVTGIPYSINRRRVSQLKLGMGKPW